MNNEKLIKANELERRIKCLQDDIGYMGIIWPYKKYQGNLRSMPVSETTLKAVQMLVAVDLQSKLDALVAEFEAL